MKQFGRTLALLWFVALGLSGCASRQPPPDSAVATAHPLATQAALRTLDNGGNAFDAAITAAAVLAVVDPHGAGLGGGGLWLLQRVDGEVTVLDTGDGLPKTRSSLSNPTPPLIPGQPAALAYLSEHFAERPFRSNLADAVRLARDGVTVVSRPGIAAPHPDAESAEAPIPSPTGTHGFLRQAALAMTLEELALQGHAGFYNGEVAKALVNDLRTAGANLSEADLASYSIRTPPPLALRIGKNRLITAPSPAGVALAQMLGMLETNPAPQEDPSERIHHLAEVMRRAFQDQALRPDGVTTTKSRQDSLLEPEYLQNLAADIDPLRATPGDTAADRSGTAQPLMSHFSIVDPDGNKVSATLSGKFPGDAGFFSAHTGIFLNQARDPLVHPHRETHPLSTMAPSVFETPQGTVVIGSAGGDRVASVLLLVLLKHLQGLGSETIVQTARFHHPGQPDEVQIESGTLSAESQFELEALGHRVREVTPYGNIQVVLVKRGNRNREAAADPRGQGQAIVRQTR